MHLVTLLHVSYQGTAVPGKISFMKNTLAFYGASVKRMPDSCSCFLLLENILPLPTVTVSVWINNSNKKQQPWAQTDYSIWMHRAHAHACVLARTPSFSVGSVAWHFIIPMVYLCVKRMSWLRFYKTGRGLFSPFPPCMHAFASSYTLCMHIISLTRTHSVSSDRPHSLPACSSISVIRRRQQNER